MAVTLPIGCIATVRHEYSLADDRAYNILHYQLATVTVMATGLPAAVDPTADQGLPALALGAYPNWATAWKDCASNQVAYDSCTAQKVFPIPRSAPYSYIPVAPTAGTVVSDALPLQDAWTILKKTGYGTRWGLGRVFVPGIAESQQDAGIMTPALVTNAALLINQVYASLDVNDGVYEYLWRPVLALTRNDGSSRITTVTSAELSNNVIKTQRRRRPGKGI